MSFSRLHVLIMHIKNRAKNVGVRKVAKLLCFVLALSLNLHSFSFHASRLAIIKACCDLPEGCFALWNNHEPLNNASLQLCFHISWTNFTRPSAPGTTASSYDHSITFLQKLVMREKERESVRESLKITSPDFHLHHTSFCSFFIFDIPNIAAPKYSQSDILFLGLEGGVLSFPSPSYRVLLQSKFCTPLHQEYFA